MISYVIESFEFNNNYGLVTEISVTVGPRDHQQVYEFEPGHLSFINGWLQEHNIDLSDFDDDSEIPDEVERLILGYVIYFTPLALVHGEFRQIIDLGLEARGRYRLQAAQEAAKFYGERKNGKGLEKKRI